MPRSNQKAEIRITREALDRLLTDRDADLHLEALQLAGVIEQLFPSVQALVGFGGGSSGHKDLWPHTKQVVRQTDPEPLLRWMALFHDVGKPAAFSRQSGKVAFHGHEVISARLFRADATKSGLFGRDEIDQIEFVIENLGHVESYEFEWTDSAVRRVIALLGDRLDDVLAVGRADCTTGQQNMKNRHTRLTSDLQRRIDEQIAMAATPQALPKGLGDAIMVKLGYAGRPLSRDEGLEMKRIMGSLKAKVEAGELPRNNPDLSIYLAHMETP